MTTTEQQKYNGWTNYATWGVALVLDNDQGTYTEVREIAAQMSSNEYPALNLADWLKDYTEELCGLEGDELSMMARQMLQAGLAGVNWNEIALNILDEV